jgi:predicted HTH domain antitoxin
MNHYRITIDLPQEIADPLSVSGVEQEIRRYLGVKYYREESLSIGKAAELAGMNRLEFERFLALNNIPISLLGYEEVKADLERLKTLTCPAG